MISELQRDGRVSLVSLGRRVGLKHSSVRSRLLKLIREGLLKVTALIDYRKLGVKLALIGLSVLDLGKCLTSLHKLCSCPHVVYMFYTTGGKYNILLLVAYRNESKLKAFIEKRLRRLPGVDDIGITLVDLTIPTFLPVKLGVLKERFECVKECSYCELKEVICTGCSVGR